MLPSKVAAIHGWMKFARTVGIEPGCELLSGSDYLELIEKVHLVEQMMKHLGEDMSTRLGDAHDRPSTSSYRSTQYVMLQGGRHTMITAKRNSVLHYTKIACLDWTFSADFKWYQDMPGRLHDFLQTVTDMWGTKHSVFTSDFKLVFYHDGIDIFHQGQSPN